MPEYSEERHVRKNQRKIKFIIYKLKYKKVGVLPIRIVYFDLYLYSAYAAHYVYLLFTLLFRV